MNEDYPIIRIPDKLTAEYGTCGDLRFVDPLHVRMYDSEGNVVLCKCGKPAGAGMMGKEACVAWCSDCSPMSSDIR